MNPIPAQTCWPPRANCWKPCWLAILDWNPKHVGSAVFTVTEDIRSAFPARAARELGWAGVPMLDGREIPVPGGLPLCIRVLLHWNTDKEQAEIRHIYLRGARALRPDLELSTLELTEEEKR